MSLFGRVGLKRSPPPPLSRPQSGSCVACGKRPEVVSIDAPSDYVDHESVKLVDTSLDRAAVRAISHQTLQLDDHALRRTAVSFQGIHVMRDALPQLYSSMRVWWEAQRSQIGAQRALSLIGVHRQPPPSRMLGRGARSVIRSSAALTRTCRVIKRSTVASLQHVGEILAAVLSRVNRRAFAEDPGAGTHTKVLRRELGALSSFIMDTRTLQHACATALQARTIRSDYRLGPPPGSVCHPARLPCGFESARHVSRARRCTRANPSRGG